jgi:hypothetical protein
LEVSNSKNVVLSSDANLGFARAQYITKERFERVEAFVNKIAKLTGKNISVEMYKIPDMGVANQNRSGIMKDEIPKERENE